MQGLKWDEVFSALPFVPDLDVRFIGRRAILATKLMSIRPIRTPFQDQDQDQVRSPLRTIA